VTQVYNVNRIQMLVASGHLEGGGACIHFSMIRG